MLITNEQGCSLTQKYLLKKDLQQNLALSRWIRGGVNHNYG